MIGLTYEMLVVSGRKLCTGKVGRDGIRIRRLQEAESKIDLRLCFGYVECMTRVRSRLEH